MAPPRRSMQPGPPLLRRTLPPAPLCKPHKHATDFLYVYILEPVEMVTTLDLVRMKDSPSYPAEESKR